MVFAKHFFEVHARCTLVFAQSLHRSGAGGGGDVFAIELGDAGDARVGFHSDAHFFHEGGVQEAHVFLTGGIVGGGAALNVNGAVLHERNAVL